MAKECTEEECENPQFGGKKCLHHQHKRTDKKKPKKRIRPIAPKREEQYKIYRPRRDKYMKEHPVCEWEGCNKLSNDLHHKNGKTNEMLYNVFYFMAICRSHHTSIDLDPINARSLGYLL